MDEFVKDKLLEWNLSEYIPAFEEPTVSPERAIQMTEWLKNNIWPPSQVSQYMLETAIQRAQWIRSNGTMSIREIMAEFPRLVDTPGMISQDFSVLHPDSPDSSEKLTARCSHVFSRKIIRMARKEDAANRLIDIDLLPADKQEDAALLLLPLILPTAPYKVGRRLLRPSSVEVRKAFIDIQPTGTNMVEYLTGATKDDPHVLMLGEDHRCSQAFVILNGTAMEYPSLLGAVDGCFKTFFVLDVNYPKPCAQIWEFIQTVIFEMPGHESNAVKLMRAQLAMN